MLAETCFLPSDAHLLCLSVRLWCWGTMFM